MSKNQAYLLVTKRKAASYKKSAVTLSAFIFTPFLILIWIIVSIGRLPLRLISITALIFYLFMKEILKISLPSFKLPKSHYSFNLKLNFIRKKPGRPRTQNAVSFYGGKTRRFINKVFPAPLRIALVLGILATLVFGYSYFLVTIVQDLPSPEKLTEVRQPLTTKFYDRNSTLLYSAYEGRNRILVNLDELPKHLIDATVAIEDKHFYEHQGIDPYAILRAAISNSQGKEFQGGSTLTQQLIKNSLLSPERTINRKIKEVILAYWAEKIYSKEEILTMYLNESPYGGPNWGVAAAAEAYFNKKPKDLDLAESAFLAGLPASPTQYSPFGSTPQLSKKRQRKVLDRMVEDGYISKKQANLAYSQKLKFNSQNNAIAAPHFVMYVRSYLAQKYGEKVVSQGGLKVETTLDFPIQEMVEDVVAEEVEKLASLNVSNGAAMVTDAKTGQILAMVGSKNYYDPNGGNYNVSLALRQPGSSIKPITYSTAFKQGYTPATILLDTPVVFKNAWETYTPVNYDGRFHGPITIRTALGSSYNVPAVKTLDLVGIQEVIKAAQDVGITTFEDPDRYGLSLTLGGGEVRMIDMMSVYGTFSQMGMKYEPTGVLKVTDSYGNVLEDNTNRAGIRVLQPGIAYMITDILSDNKARTPAFGPNSLLNIPGHQVAVKTGTTDNKKDNLAYGYTPEFVVGAWVGNNNNALMHPSLTSGVTGATPIWNRIMTNLLEGREPVAFERPSDVAEAVVDGKKDLVLIGTTPKSVVSLGKKRVKDDKTQEEKEVITFTDPFNTYVPGEVNIPANP